MNLPEPQSTNYSSIINEIEKGLVKIPQFQRDFVWTKEKSAKLIDSIVKGYPIGTFILWKTKESLRVVRNIGNSDLPATPKGDFIQYVLDGQQRLTSLFACIKGLKIERNNSVDDFSEIYIDLNGTVNDSIVLTEKTTKNKNEIIKIIDLINKDFTFLASFPKKYHEKLANYKKCIESYSFSLIMIKEASIDVATEIFTRINVTGKPLSVFEIMVAKTFDDKRNFDLSEKYEEFIDKLKNVNYETISDTTILQTVSILLKKECTKRVILRLNKKKFIDIWDSAIDAIENAIDYFKSFYRIPVSKLLPYNALVIPFAYFFFKHPSKPTGNKQKYLQDFFWRASLSGRYSHALETKLAQDIKKIDKILNNQLPEYEYPIDVSPKFIKDNGWFNAGRSYIKAILCIYAYHQPKSFIDDSIVNINNDWLKQANSKNYHHFFPKAYLHKKNKDEFYINHIANITIVDDFLNKREIGHKPPSNYMSTFANKNPQIEKTMKSHLINLKEFGIWDDDFDTFLNKRCNLTSKELRKRVIKQDIDKQHQNIYFNDQEEIELET